MSDPKKENRQANIKLSELILSARSLGYQIEKLRRERFLTEKVIDLNDYRELRKAQELKKVLVVDDEEGVRGPLTKALEKQGYQALFARSANELAGIIETHTFGLVLIELRLSWINAFEFSKLMKANKILRDIPIILISQEASKKEIRKAFEYGCDEYVAKPFKLDRLVRTIKYFLENY